MALNGIRTASVLVFGVAVLAAPVAAREVRLPLSVEPPMIREALMRKLFNDGQKRAVFWGEPGSCNYFYLVDPEVEGGVDRLRIFSKGDAKLGTDLGAGCLSPIGWSGFLEVFERPRLDGWLLRFEVVDSNLYDEMREKQNLIGEIWDRIKESVHPNFAAVTIDLAEPFRQLRDFLPTAIGKGRGSEDVLRALDTMRPVSVRALPRGIVIEAALVVPDVPAAAPSGAEPPLSTAEIDAFTARANQWDAFVTFAVKTLGAKTLSKPARQALLDTLLDARYQTVAILSDPTRRQDPVRPLFVKSWERLRPVAEEIARNLPGAEAAGVLTFVAAGDALHALDQLGPTFGIEISADGLRRMARMIAPDEPSDPLEYDPGTIDPVLRRFLGFGDSLPDLPALPPSPETAPPEPPLEPAPAPSPMTFWLRWLEPSNAEAASKAPEKTVDRSKDTAGWVVEDAPNVDAYLKRVREMLTRVSGVASENLKPDDAALMRRLIPATAWQESCWRQFRKRGDTATYVRSRRGSVGIMQVNERVWRGFYEAEKLRWRPDYNARAGAEVLIHYLEMLDDPPRGLRKLATRSDRARAVYAAYNGGPDQMRAYADPKRRGTALARVIDGLFGTKFDEAGDKIESGVASCLGVEID